MRNFLFILVFTPFITLASEPLKSCITYSFKEVKLETAEFVLENIFTEDLYQELQDNFPDVKLDWKNWSTSAFNKHDDASNTKRTYLRGCFDVTNILDKTDLIKGIMSVASDRFRSALNFYAENTSNILPNMNDSGIFEKYKKLLKEESQKRRMDGSLE